MPLPIGAVPVTFSTMNRFRIALIVLSIVSLIGCSRPNTANITLRKQNQQLQSNVDQLQRDLGGAKASIKSFESRATTVPILPGEQIDKLFTTHELRFGRNTGPADLDALQPGEEGLKVQIAPVDQTGQPIKAAGTFKIDAFDLAQTDNPHIGHWEFSPDEAGKNFYSMLTLYTYVLPLPWQQLPKHKDITLRVTFDDSLTHRTFTAEKVVIVNPSATTRPATMRASS
jgi:outer membrane murein-binding lipoprotein Lpp